MDRQKLINEIRGLQKTKAKFLEDVETKLEKEKVVLIIKLLIIMS